MAGFAARHQAASAEDDKWHSGPDPHFLCGVVEKVWHLRNDADASGQFPQALVGLPPATAEEVADHLAHQLVGANLLWRQPLGFAESPHRILGLATLAIRAGDVDEEPGPPLG